MKQTPRNSQADLAFGSVTAILENIYAKTESGNEFLDSITKTLNNISTKIEIKLETVCDLLKNFSGGISDTKTTTGKEAPSSPFELLNPFKSMTNILGSFKGFFDKIGNLLSGGTSSELLEYVKKIHDILEKKESGGQQSNVIIDTKSNTLLGFFDKLSTKVDKKFTSAFGKFVSLYERLISKENTEKFKEFTTEIKSLSLSLLSLKKSILGLTLGIGLMAIVLSIPVFWIGAGVFILFLFGLKKAMNGMKIEGEQFKQLAFGIGILALSLIAISFVSWGGIAKFLGFLGTLGLAIFMLNKFSPTKGAGTELVFLGIGIGILAMALVIVSFVSWGAIAKFIIFLGALGGTLFLMNKANPREGIGIEMIKIGMGIGILALSLIVVSLLPWEGIFKLIVFISLLGLTIGLSQMMMNKMGGVKGGAGMVGGGKGMFGFAAGLAILVLAIYATSELDWAPALKLLAFIFALGMAIAIPGLISKGKSDKGGMVGFAFGVGLLVLTIWAAAEVNWEPAFYIVGFITAIGLALKLLGADSGKKLLMLSLGIGAMAASVWLLAQTNITLDKVLIFGYAVLMFIAIGYIAGTLKSEIMKGGLALLVLGATTFATAWLLSKALEFEYNFVNLLLFLAVVAIMTLAFVGLGFVAPYALPGAILVLALAVASVAITIPLMIIQYLSYDNVPTFVETIKFLTIEYFKLLPFALGALPASFMLIPIGGASIIVGMALVIISLLKINDSKVKAYTSALTKIVKTIDSFGLFSLAKSVVKSYMLIPIIAVMTGAAIALKAISLLDISETKMEGFGKIIRKFIDLAKTEINNASDILEDIGPGLESLAKIANIGSSMVDLVSAFASGTYNEYAVDKDGKIYIKSVHPLNDDSYAKAGQNFGELLKVLLKPIVTMGSDAKQWDFDGVMVDNPFAGGKSSYSEMASVRRITEIGNAYASIMEVISNFASLDIARDKEALTRFDEGFSITIARVVESFNKLQEIKQLTKIDLVVKNISNFGEAFSFFDVDKMEKISNNISTIIDTVSNTDWDLLNKNYSKVNTAYLTILDVKWDAHNNRLEAAVKNYQKIGKQYEIISKNINSIDIEKAIALEKNLKLLTDMKANENLEKVIDKLKELIGLIKEEQDRQQQILVTQQQVKLEKEKEEQEKILKIGTKDAAGKKTEPATINEKQITLLDDIKSLLDVISKSTDNTSDLLSLGTAKVKIVNSNEKNYLE